MQSFWYLLDTQGSYWPKLRAVRSFSLLTNQKQCKIYDSVLRFGPHTPDRPKKLQTVDVWIQKNHTCVHRTRNPNEVREFKHCCVCFRTHHVSSSLDVYHGTMKACVTLCCPHRSSTRLKSMPFRLSSAPRRFSIDLRRWQRRSMAPLRRICCRITTSNLS